MDGGEEYESDEVRVGAEVKINTSVHDVEEIVFLEERKCRNNEEMKKGLS